MDGFEISMHPFGSCTGDSVEAARHETLTVPEFVRRSGNWIRMSLGHRHMGNACGAQTSSRTTDPAA